MDRIIDDVAKALATTMPRRQMFGLVGGIFATAFFAMFTVEPLSAKSCSKAQLRSGSRSCRNGDDEHGDDHDDGEDDRDNGNNGNGNGNGRGGDDRRGVSAGAFGGFAAAAAYGASDDDGICCPPNTCCAAKGRKLSCCAKGSCVCNNGTCAPSGGGKCPSGCSRC